jgi:hypothetical protein
VKCQPDTLTALIDALQRRCAGMQVSKPNALTIGQSASVPWGVGAGDSQSACVFARTIP